MHGALSHRFDRFSVTGEIQQYVLQDGWRRSILLTTPTRKSLFGSELASEGALAFPTPTLVSAMQGEVRAIAFGEGQNFLMSLLLAEDVARENLREVIKAAPGAIAAGCHLTG